VVGIINFNNKKVKFLGGGGGGDWVCFEGGGVNGGRGCGSVGEREWGGDQGVTMMIKSK
jgi:hypothetical protein